MVTKTIVLTVLSFVLQSGASFAQQCLHENGEAPEQQARRKEALAAARMINTIQHNRPEARNGVFLTPEGLATLRADVMPDSRNPTMQRLSFAPDTDVIPGWRLSLELTQTGYWFAIKDATDPCGFSYISNTSGLIYNAQPIR